MKTPNFMKTLTFMKIPHMYIYIYHLCLYLTKIFESLEVEKLKAQLAESREDLVRKDGD